MKKFIYSFFTILCGFCLLQVPAQGQQKASTDNTLSASGIVLDTKTGEALIGVTIIVKNESGVGVVTDVEGRFTIKRLAPNSVLVFSYIGYENKEVLVMKNIDNLKVSLEESTKALDEVIVVGQGTQRKVSVVGAITTIDPKDLQVPATSVTNMLGGRVPGIIAVTRSGEPGQDFSEFWVRGISTFGANASALVLIDGVEGNLNDLDPADIESFSVLKDASATAVYGVRGANGVVVVTTHRGKAGKLSINIKTNATISYSPRMPEYLESYDYARLANEARIGRGLSARYDEVELGLMQYGLDEDLYPNVNWRDVILRNATWNNQHYLNINGGGAVARYFMSVGMQNKSAVFQTDEVNKYNTNVNWHKYTFRANVDANLTKTTILSMGLDGTIVKQNAPGYGSDNSALWSAQASLTPLTVPVKYSNGFLPAYGKSGEFISPYVLLNETGMKRNTRNSTKINFGLKQDLEFITKGLSTAALFSFSSNTVLNTMRNKMPALYKASGRYNDGSLIIEKTVSQTSATFDRYRESDRKYYFEARANYDRAFDRHRVGALIHYYMEDFQTSKASDEVNSIPKRYQALSGRATYSFDDTYFIEGNIGYTGSENFRPGQQFGIFPAIAIGWAPTQYEFIQNAIPFINFFKVRASYGEVGNDRIAQDGAGNDIRFPYMTYVNFNNSGRWGSNGLTEGQIGAENLKWEVAKKYNLGFDVTLFHERISLTVDIFKDVRDGIFQQRYLLPVEVGAVNPPYTNVGSMQSSGCDGNISYTHTFNKNLTATVRGNMTFSKNKVKHWDEPLKLYPYQSKEGKPHNVNRGLVSMGLFRDSLEIQSSPKQTYGEVRPGDIRYKDINGDGKIDDDDVVPISYSAVPQIQYGFAAQITYKKWSFSAFFEGISKVNYFYGGAGYYPYSGGETGNVLTMVNDKGARWTPGWYSGDPSTENPDARFPRLTYGNSANNNRNSTFWLANGRYLRLKNIDISYQWQNKWLQHQIGIQSITFQVVGDNLACWDSVKLWDPGQASKNGSVYPVQRTFTFQLSIAL